MLFPLNEYVWGSYLVIKIKHDNQRAMIRESIPKFNTKILIWLCQMYQTDVFLTHRYSEIDVRCNQSKWICLMICSNQLSGVRDRFHLAAKVSFYRIKIINKGATCSLDKILILCDNTGCHKESVGSTYHESGSTSGYQFL